MKVGESLVVIKERESNEERGRSVSVTLRCRIVVDGLSCVELGVCLSCFWEW
jgi:hypothetical protein